MSGHLYLVGTPIGHLGDISQRARETLASVSHIYAEDTRHTRALLSHLGIEGKKLLSLHAHSTAKALGTALEILQAGSQVALVTDAGMPSVSDPGSELVKAAREAGVGLSVVPGPSAVTSAVALSGLVNGPFCFLGFLPRKGRAREEAMAQIHQSSLPTVLFESPHRMSKTLVELLRVCGPTRQLAICRELTKRFEETVVAPLGELAERDAEGWRGEITLVIERSAEGARGTATEVDLDEELRQSLNAGESVRDATERAYLALTRGGTRPKRRQIYARALELSEGRDADSPADHVPPEDAACGPKSP